MKKIKEINIFLACVILFANLMGCTVSEPNSVPAQVREGASSAASSNPSQTSQSTQNEKSKSTEEPSKISEKSEKSDISAQQSPIPNTSNSSGKLKVHYIDVGQADSILVETPSHHAMLIDAGNNDDGDKVVNYVRKQGINKIDVLVATHPHEDHIGGMDTVVRSLDIGKVYMPKASSTTKTFEDLLNAIKDKGLKISTAKAGVDIEGLGDGVTGKILGPVGDGYEDLNNYSAVVKLQYGDSKFLFCGDAEEASEKEILASGADVKVDVIKIGHHGSSSSSSKKWLDAVGAKSAVISVGKNNEYKHPDPGTIGRLKELGLQVYRTDEVGTIMAECDGSTIKFDKNASPQKENAPPVVEEKKNSEVKVVENKADPEVNTVPKVEEKKCETKDITVYITKTGEKYHTSGCQYLRKSKIAISLSDAKSSGYSACSKCGPPQ